MPTVRDTVHDLLRSWGLTTVFGNPGSNELPFLDGFPPDFRYVLGLHEGAVLAMADGYAQATGRPALVNLHSAAGLGHAVGNLANARASNTPLVVTAGQQNRTLVGLNAVLGEPELVRVPEPQVKWACEPTTAQDVPRALAEAFHRAALPPAGPVFVSLPMDDWGRQVDPAAVARIPGRRVSWAGAAAPEVVGALAERMAAARTPALVVGPEVDDERAFGRVVALAERWRAAVWTAPTPPRCPFPTRHPLWRGVLPPSIAGVSEHLTGHDLVLVLGAPVFRYHANRPGPWLPDGTELVAVSSDPGSAARAPFGDALVGDVAAIAGQLLAALPAEPERPPPAPRGVPHTVLPDEGPFPADALFAALAEALPASARLVNESTANTTQFWEQIDLREPRSLLFPAAGGLGFGLPAAVGMALADPDRPVVAVLGDGAAQYGITGLWTAARHRLPVTFLVLRNGGYGALRGIVSQLGVQNAPGLDLPDLDAVRIAEGYGVPGCRVSTARELKAALSAVASTDGPRLVEVPVPTEVRRFG
ncbi:MAG TPA: benzoylformate decarboxylase [Pseudonocardia sp.]|uniref:benzoylformate decarboxylase n=1 Tax=Pseudonocardia sp. TaxID=60912 RepID=UPI002B4B7D19|nr:benzoylformate decarboxylase [Pseudonocardia sp.]HLU54492.1 benzoylformate decarboxylase [Pseudonocardia sp.]